MSNKIIGKKLKKLRMEAKYSCQEVARYFNNNVETIEMWEKGELQPNVEQILILSYLYGISIDEIMSEINPIEVIPEELQDEYRHEALVNRICRKSCVL